MGASPSKHSDSQGGCLGFSPDEDEDHLFYEDPLLSDRVDNCFHSLSKESIDEFLEREGPGDPWMSGTSCLPTVEQINEHLALTQRGYLLDGFHLYLNLRVRRLDISGSVADRLGSANIDQQPFTFASDLNIMFELDLNVGFSKESLHQTALRAEPSTTHSGFFILRPTSSPMDFDFCRDEHGGALTAHEVREQLAEAARRAGYEDVAVNGPAITCQYEDFHLSYDLVPCLRVAWPTKWLTEFRQRRRPSGWPGPSLLERLHGHLHLVPKPPYKGERRFWRISFSRPESLLAQNLPPEAHFCLMMLRAARSALGPAASLIAPYHLKMCVFWLCERKPPELWAQRVNAMCTVLDALRLFATAGFLPNFLQPSINVLAEPDATYRARLYRQATHFRGQLQPMLQSLVDRFSKPWEETIPPSMRQPTPSKKATPTSPHQKATDGAKATAQESAPPPRHIFIQPDVMALVPDGALDAATNARPSNDWFVEDMRQTMETLHSLWPATDSALELALPSYRQLLE